MKTLRRNNREILQLAIPSIVSNLTIPLLGLVDITMVGHMHNTTYIGAIAVGGMLFSLIYWGFTFLRMGTGGITSQAFGRDDASDIIHTLVRALIIAFCAAFMLIAIQHPVRHLVFYFVDATPAVQQGACTYFHICIWGAPAVLSLYVFNGWFIGMQNARFPMVVAIVQNCVNILASLCLVLVFGMQIEGIAWGTVIAQYCGLALSVILWLTRYRHYLKNICCKVLYTPHELSRFFQVNTDIFLRNLCMISVMVFFTSQGAHQGDIILAINTLLMQLFTIFCYFMDGFAYAGEALTGKYIGKKDYTSLYAMARLLYVWGISTSTLFTLLYIFGGEQFLQLLTNDAEVLTASSPYLLWSALIPLSSFLAFLLDGICIGATATRAMLIAIAIASASFFVVYFGLRGIWHNHALWLAFNCYLALRGIVQHFVIMRQYKHHYSV